LPKDFPLKNDKTFIVAEAEINHNGDLATALKMLETAGKIGADAVKFQYIIADEIASPDSDYYDLFKKVELTHDECLEIMANARERNIECFFTAPSIMTLQRIVELNPPYIKIGSSNITNLSLLDAVNQAGIPVILSTGTATIGEIETALNRLPDLPVSLLHCTVQYPVKDPGELNLNAISTLQSVFPSHCIGYSDHTTGPLASAVAVVNGAKIIEKHFTLDRTQEGPDHAFSTDVEGFRQLIEAIRYTEMALGDGVKRPSASETSIVKNVRRYIVATKDINIGDTISSSNVSARRIAYFEGAVGAEFIDIVTGWETPCSFEKGTPLNWTALKTGNRT